MKNIEEHHVHRFPSSRLATIDIGRIAGKMHHVAAFLELDVTDARQLIRAKRNKKEPVSMTSWLIACIGRICAENPVLHGVRKGRRDIVVFRDVDVSLMIEKSVDGVKVPLPYIIRKANQKSMDAIALEIEGGKQQTVVDESDFVLGQKQAPAWAMNAYYCLPGSLRRLVWQLILRNPARLKRNMGTVMVTSVGMMGVINGWVLPDSIHPICFAIGSVIKKPAAVGQTVQIREFLHVTALVDHDVIDGAPAIRSLAKLVGMVESSWGLKPQSGRE